MAPSEAKIAANRRNAQKSTGPRTEEGKKRSCMNALKYGTRAETVVLPGEDKQELDERRATWTASLGPRCELEQRAVDQAVVYSWRQDRAWRAEAKRAHARLEELADDEPAATAEQEAVFELGRRLFTDRMGALRFYPATYDQPRIGLPRNESTSYPSKHDDEPDIPEVLVLRLQSTVKGCEWLLGEWTKLKAILDAGKVWISTDRLKAVRLLGRQPLDVLDDQDVAMVYLASHWIEPVSSEWAWEIFTEMDESNRRRFQNDVDRRKLEALQPRSIVKARGALLAIVARQMERLTAKAESHRQRNRAKAARLASLLDFDDTIEGERLRKFETTSGRGYDRAITTLLKLRKEDGERRNEDSDRPWSVVHGPLLGDPLSNAVEMADVIAETDARDETALAEEQIDLSWALEIDTDALHGISRNDPEHTSPQGEILTEEAAIERENVTNEPTAESLDITATPCCQSVCATRPAEAPIKNEPTDGSIFAFDGVFSCTASHAETVDPPRRGERSRAGCRKRPRERGRRSRALALG